MLASTAETVGEAVEGFELASVEWKLDGIRIQVHRRGDETRIYTRNLNEITDALPGIAAAVRLLPVRQVVLDGEALWMGEDGPAAFQDTVSRIDREGAPEGVVTFLFDLLHVDGDDLLDRPAAERLVVLESRVPEALRVPRIATADPIEAERFLDEALERGHEGVMVKALDAPYQAGRRGASWLKVKRAHTLDLVVLAVDWGHGRRQGFLSNLHLGARDPAGGWVMLGKTFKGMTDETLAWQTARFLELETHRDSHTVFLRPEQVVEIAFDGVQTSPRYPGGVALRFARVKGYRQDKRPEEADTIDTVRAIHAGG